MAVSHHNRRNCIKRIPALGKFKSLPYAIANLTDKKLSTFNLPCINVVHNCNPCIKKRKSCLGLSDSHCLCSISQKHTQIKFIVFVLTESHIAQTSLKHTENNLTLQPSCLCISNAWITDLSHASNLRSAGNWTQGFTHVTWTLYSWAVANPKWWLLCFT